MSTTQPGFDLIWAWREEMGDVYTGEWAPADDPHAPMEAVEYVRADVHAAQIADLQRQLAEARNAAASYQAELVDAGIDGSKGAEDQ